MLDKNNEVFFGEYCKTCKYKNYSETDSPCAECIAEPVNLYSHKPVKWEGADGIFSGPPPRPDHAYQRAVKYVPERRKDKEKAIARLNIDAEYTGNKVQSIDGDVTDDQYPSATAVKKALEGQEKATTQTLQTFGEQTAQSLARKIDAPSGCKCGEFLAVEEVNEEGVVKKVKAAEVQTDPPDWNENDPTKSGYIENRPFYERSEEFIGAIEFTATSEITMKCVVSEEDMDTLVGIQSLTGKGAVLKAYVDGQTCMSKVSFSYGSIGIAGELGGSVYFNPGATFNVTVHKDNLTLVLNKTYTVDFYNANGPFYKTISEDFFPDTIFSQKNAPVKFGISGNGELNQSAVQGDNTTASGYGSHAEGDNTVANRRFLSVSGSYNLYDDAKYIPVTTSSTMYFWTSDTIYESDSFTFDNSTGKFTLVNPIKRSYTQININKFYMLGTTSGKTMYVPTSLKENLNNRIGYYVSLHKSEIISIHRDQYAVITGNGTSDAERSNAYTLDWKGNAWFAGDVYVGSTSGTNKDDGSKRLVTEDQLTYCFRVPIMSTQSDDGTITYSSPFTASFVFNRVLEMSPVLSGNSIECCLLPIEPDGPTTVLSYIGQSKDENSDGNTTLALKFSAYVSGKHISAEIQDTISGAGTDNAEILSTVVTVTEEPVVTWVDLLFCYGDWNEVYKDLKKGVIRSIFTIGSYTNTQSGTPKTLGVLYYDGTHGPKLKYTMFGHDGVIYRIDFDRQYNTFSSMALTNKPLPAPTTAQVGQIVSVKSIDESGKVTETESVDIPNRLDVTVSMGDNGWVVSHKFAEIKAAYDAGRAVQLINIDTSRKYSLIAFFPGSIESVTYADFRFIDDAGDIWKATINSNDEIDFFQEGTFITLYGDIPQDTPKAITYSVVSGIGYADFIPYIEIPSTGDELKERLVISPAYFYVMPNAYAPFALKNLVNPYMFTRLSHSEPQSDDGYYEASYLVTDSLGQQVKATCQVHLTDSGLGDLIWSFVTLRKKDALIVNSSTEGSTKKFRITVDDAGTISATEVVGETEETGE